MTGSRTTSPSTQRHGKGEITIGHVLAHRAGVARLSGDALDLDKLVDREFLVELLCDVKPASRPGRLLAYHAVSGGFILGEIVERVTGKSIREVLAEEILRAARAFAGATTASPPPTSTR